MWKSFGDQFLAAVDSKINIPDVVKFSFSRGDLYKDVQEPICGLLVTNKNYSIALKTFTRTLYKWTILISSYMESFVYETLQSITYMKNVSGLRAIYDLVEVFLLIHMANFLIEKVPHSLCLVVSREFDDKVWDLENMLKYFKK